MTKNPLLAHNQPYCKDIAQLPFTEMTYQNGVFTLVVQLFLIRHVTFIKQNITL